MSTRNRSNGTPEVWWELLTVILKSMRNRPLAWLTGFWLCGWALLAWQAVHPASWNSVWGLVNSIFRQAERGGGQPFNPGASVAWLQEVARWGQAVLFVSTGSLAIYVCCALWLWWRYMHVWLPKVREERLRGGRVLEVLIPKGSKADARAAADMLGQLWNLLSDLAGGGAGPRKMGPERLALSLEMWCTPQTGNKVGFYIWCPTSAVGRPEDDELASSARGRDPFVEEVRELIRAYHPRCRVRWVDDPVEKAVIELATQAGHAGVIMTWHEIGLLADSRYPIGSGASDERPHTGSRASSRTGSPGAGSDALAAVISMLTTDEEVPAMGIQVVIAAHREASGKAQRAVNKELARLRELEMQASKRTLGPQHEARVLALEEKADRQGFDVIIRLVAVEPVDATEGRLGSVPRNRAEARLTALFRKYRQYDRAVAEVRQGFQVVRTGRAGLSAANPRPLKPSRASISAQSWQRVAPVLGRWPREGVCLPRLLPSMRIGKPCLLNMAELSAIYHFPHQGLERVAPVRWATYRQIPPPAQAHVTAEQVAKGYKVMLGGLDADLPQTGPDKPTPMGTSAQTRKTYSPDQPSESSQSAVGANVLLPGMRGVGTSFDELRRGTYVLGPMGSGKSVFLYNMAVQHMAAGRGIGILDGKGDSYEEVLRLVPPHLEGEVLTFDPENRSKSGGLGGRSIGINPLDGRVAAQLGIERVEALAMSLMRKMIGANWEGAVLMQRFMRDGITAVMHIEPIPSMLNLWRWLQDDGKGGNEYREAHLGRIENPLVRDFWQRQVPAMSAQQRSSMQNVLTRVDRYVKSDVRYLLLQPHSTVNFQEIMDQGTIFVGRVSPRLGENQSFLGALALNGFLTGAFARQSIPQEKRRDYLLVVDEFQNFVDTARSDVERMLSMARGYRLGLMLAHQYTDQLPKEVLSAILKNVQTWVVFGLQADDARRFAAYMEGLEAEDFQNLPPYYTYQRTIVENRSTGVYSAAPLPIPAPAPNPGERPVRSQEKERQLRMFLELTEQNREVLRTAHAPERVRKLAYGPTEESESDKRIRLMKLAREVYWPAEEGNPDVVQMLSTLNDPDREVYRQARQMLDAEEREMILAYPGLIRDKMQRIERLSALRWGTPCVEVEALVHATLRGGASGSNETRPGDRGPNPLIQVDLNSLLPSLPDFTDDGDGGPEERPRG